MTYNFNEQLAIGNAAESKIAKLLSLVADVKLCNDMDTQRRGIDMMVNNSISLEIKWDAAMLRTGNAFLETDSYLGNGKHFKRGWVYTTQADYVVIMPGNSGVLKIVKPSELRRHMDNWLKQFGTRSCRNNDGFKSEGCCVPAYLIPGLTLTLSATEAQTFLTYIEDNLEQLDF